MNQPTMALRVTDLQRMTGFLVDTLGFDRTDVDADPDVARVLDSDGDVLLIAGPGATDLEARLAERHAVFAPGETLLFKRSDLTEYERLLRAAGLSELSLTTKTWGDRQLAVTAPDDYHLKFVDRADLSDEELLDLYAEGPSALDEALGEVDDEVLERREVSGWSVRMLVHHISDGDVLWLGAIFAALVSPGTPYGHDWYTTDADAAKQLDYDGRPIDGALDQFRAARAHLVDTLQRVDGALDRTVQFRRRYESSGAPMTVREMLRRRAVHTLEHVAEVQTLTRPRA